MNNFQLNYFHVFPGRNIIKTGDDTGTAQGLRESQKLYGESPRLAQIADKNKLPSISIFRRENN